MNESKPLIYAWLEDNTRIQEKFTPDRIHEKLTIDIESYLDERNKIITFHLYIEYWLNKILEKMDLFKKKDIDKTSFYEKTKILWDKKVLDKTTYDNIILLNKLRNKYAHVLEIENLNEEIQRQLRMLIIDPYFFTTDKDRFKAICIQTLFFLEAIYNNNYKPIDIEYPSNKIRNELLKEGEVFWQSCKILKKEEPRHYEEEHELKCPLCMKGTITRFKDNQPGFKDSSFHRCGICGLTGNGSYLYLKTAKDEYKK